MKRFYYALLLACTGFALSTQQGVAQSDLDIFGYFQTTFTHIAPVDSISKPSNSFAVQQLNVFLNKELNENFSAFINLEVLNNFAFDRNWGGLNLEEAWLKYDHSDALSVKAGLLLPRFNNLNEIKNRTPLLPYIRRPLVYEASMGDLLNLEAYVPQRAFLQVMGRFALGGEAKLDYAVFAGNSDKSYTYSATGGGGIRGTDSTTYKMVGGRLGFTYSDLKLGVSGTYDRQNLNTYKLGDIPRTRFGADLTYSIAGFTLEGEIIMVGLNFTDAKQAVLDSLAAASPALGNDGDKLFYYGNLTYNISPDLYAYAGYSYMEDKLSKFFGAGLSTVTFGAGYRPIEQVVLKTQYAKVKFGENPIRDYERDYYYVGASVFF